MQLTLLLMQITLFCIVGTLAERAPTWDHCKCRWLSWSSWSQCSSSCGGGVQSRSRKVKHQDVPECDGFDKCATDDMGFNIKSCNTICYNRGQYETHSSYYGYCKCPKGAKGRCCEQIVTCGSPSSISHGTFSGSSYNYGHEIKYYCNTDYKMTSSSSTVLRCNEYGSWSRTAPKCIYAASCKSDPCQNQARCTNMLGDYSCSCQPGWAGKNCEIDIQRPVVDQCPDDKDVHTNNMTSTINWKEPKFHDPMGNPVQVTKNYQNDSFTFPWGEYTIQYSAVKPTNGLSNECAFNVTLKPYPCKTIDPPKHGYAVCNSWMADYSKICKLGCRKGYTFSPEFKDVDWYICGATGQWFPSSPPLECFEQLLPQQDVKESPVRLQMTDCSNHTELQTVGNEYIKQLLESNFNSLCLDYSFVCKVENVKVTC